MFCVPEGVLSTASGRRMLLTTPQGGPVVVDRIMLQIWQYADGRTEQDILSHLQNEGLPPEQVAGALACLKHAGLLAHPGPVAPESPPAPQPPQSDQLVSALIVSYNSRQWLPGCLASLRSQSHASLETIVVDNGSRDGSADWLAAQHPEVKLVRLEAACSLASAINRGIEMAQGEYILLLNPDVILDARAVSQLVQAAQEDARCAAVAAKLRLLWAPAFLNGLGNLAGLLFWGTDIALGYLDLGQFDQWTELPSACFAATLLPVQALRQIGPLDEKFPLYYEDIEWCYRARWLGYTVRPAPQALVYHALSGRVPGVATDGLDALKLRRVVYGRLRFVTRLLVPGLLFRFIASYLLEDLVNIVLHLARGRWEQVRAYGAGWMDYFRSLGELRRERKIFRQRSRLGGRELFRLQRRLPAPLVRRGLPLLTWDIVCHEYLPWLQTHAAARSKMSLPRALAIWQVEGFAALAHRIGRRVLWKWMQP